MLVVRMSSRFARSERAMKPNPAIERMRRSAGRRPAPGPNHPRRRVSSVDLFVHHLARHPSEVNFAEPDDVASIPIDHFDGLNSFEDLPRDGSCVADYWF